MKKIEVYRDKQDLKIEAVLIENKTYVQLLGLVRVLSLPYDIIRSGNRVTLSTKTHPKRQPLLGSRIAISAGHGNSRNVSPINKAYNESDFVLQVARKLELKLLADGAAVFLPRRLRSEDMSLTERTNRISSFGADITLDIHTDASSDSKARGVHCISSVNRPPNLAAYLASSVAASMGLPIRQRGVWQKKGPRGFDWHHMLRVPHGHNVIIEGGFHSSPEDMAILLRPEAVENYATGLHEGLLSYLMD